MTNIDPQTILGPKASLTKLAWVTLPKTGDGAFSAFMAAPLPVMAAESEGDATGLQPDPAAQQFMQEGLDDLIATPPVPMTAEPEAVRATEGEGAERATDSSAPDQYITPHGKDANPPPEPKVQSLQAPTSVEQAPTDEPTKTAQASVAVSPSALDQLPPRKTAPEPHPQPAMPGAIRQGEQPPKTDGTNTPPSLSNAAETLPFTAAEGPEQARPAVADPSAPIELERPAPTHRAEPPLAHATNPQPAQITTPSPAMGPPTAGLTPKRAADAVIAEPKTAQSTEPVYHRSKIAAVQFVTGYDVPAPAVDTVDVGLPAVTQRQVPFTERTPTAEAGMNPSTAPALPGGFVTADAPNPAIALNRAEAAAPTRPQSAPSQLASTATLTSDANPAPVLPSHAALGLDTTTPDRSSTPIEAASAVPQATPTVLVAPSSIAKPMPVAPERIQQPPLADAPQLGQSPQAPAPQASSGKIAVAPVPHWAGTEAPIPTTPLKSAYSPTRAAENAVIQNPAVPAQTLVTAQGQTTAQITITAIPQNPVVAGKAAETVDSIEPPIAQPQMPPQNPYGDRANVAPTFAQALNGASAKPLLNALPEPTDLPTAPRQWGEPLGTLPASIAATTTPAQAPTSVTLPQPIPVSAVATILKDHTAPGKAKTIELTLAPEELGQVRLLLQPDGDKMRIVVQAERPETLEMLRRNTEAFSSELRQSGVANTSFSFGGWGEHPGKSATPQNDGEGVRISSAPTVEFPIATRAPRLTTGLDLRV